MENYQRILVAIDIYSEYDLVLGRALKVAKDPKDIHLVFVTLPTTYFQPYISGVANDFIIDIEKQAQQRLKEIAKKRAIPEEQLHVPIGAVADEIQELANDLNCDLIVIGTHGQSGLKLLLGSTANAVLHGVKQDVLAVRVYD